MADAEIYPMPMFNRLSVSNVTSSTEWYQKALAFEPILTMEGLAHLRYRKYADLLLLPSSETIDPEQQGRGVSICINMEGETIEELTDRARKAGATIEREPTETPHNTREVVITDPDGYELVFSEPVDTKASFEEVMRVDGEAMGSHK